MEKRRWRGPRFRQLASVTVVSFPCLFNEINRVNGVTIPERASLDSLSSNLFHGSAGPMAPRRKSLSQSRKGTPLSTADHGTVYNIHICACQKRGEHQLEVGKPAPSRGIVAEMTGRTEHFDLPFRPRSKHAPQPDCTREYRLASECDVGFTYGSLHHSISAPGGLNGGPSIRRSEGIASLFENSPGILPSR